MIIDLMTKCGNQGGLTTPSKPARFTVNKNGRELALPNLGGDL
jgi:hypothetical protein